MLFQYISTTSCWVIQWRTQSRRMLPSQNSQSQNSLVVVVVLYILTLCVLSVQVLDGDFFLVACRADFIENARLCIFETFCRIHQCISIRCYVYIVYMQAMYMYVYH